MIFLTDFIAKGFKSFANKIDVSFDGNLIGIIGPNGSGKTNFIDGIKWVLGEQSNKELRSRAKNELVFHGSQSVPAATKASVTLKFNNKNRILKYDADEVTVTKTYDVEKNESTFFVNEQLSTLTAVKALFANSGLTKGSLCIISNHSVDWFANAKPAERKEIFISAAGVKPFLEDKKEAIKNLNNTSTELEKLNNTIRYISRDAESLRSQVGEVEIYNQKFENLKRLELNYYGFNLPTWISRIEELKNNLYATNQLVDVSNKKIENFNQQIEKLDAEIREYDQIIDDYYDKITNLNKNLNDLKNEQFALNQDHENAINGNNLELKIQGYQNIISSETTKVNALKEQEQKLNDAIATYDQMVSEQRSHLDNLLQKEKEDQINLNKLNNEKSNLEFRNRSNLSSQKGIKALLDAKNHFNGLYGIVQEYLSIPKNLELAMSFAFAKTLSNFIVEDDEVAKNCINYLTKNKAGRCAFIPLKVVKAKTIDERTQIILNETKGYLGVASDLVKIEPKYQVVLKNLVGNIIIADNIDNAKIIAKRIQYRYKVIDLEGNVFNPGGIIVGGYNNESNTIIFNYQEKINDLNSQIENYQVELEKIKQEIISHKQILESNTNILNTKKSDLEFCKRSLNLESDNLKKHKQEYDAILIKTNTKIDFDVVQNDLVKRIVEVEEQINNYENKLKMTRELKQNATIQRGSVSEEMKESNDFINSSLRSVNAQSNELNALETKYENAKARIISHYEMTEENVIENYNHEVDMDESQIIMTINRLRNELGNMKNINFQAAEQLSKIEEDLNAKNDQKNELLGTINSLKEIITRLQKQAVTAYINLIDKINETLPSIFEYLFNGGWCKVSLDGSSEDIFEQGVNVSVNPIGQKISSLYLLSSGQKTLVALSVLFAILKASNYPLVIFDEAEAALDPNNVVRFSNLIKQYSDNTQFVVITHRNGTMQICDYLYGVTMPTPGISDVIKLNLNDVKKVVTGE